MKHTVDTVRIVEGHRIVGIHHIVDAHHMAVATGLWLCGLRLKLCWI